MGKECLGVHFEGQPMLYTLDLFSTIVFAMTGALIAREQRRNGFSAVLFALLTAVGGGTIRDILLGQQPVFWIRMPVYLGLASIVGLLTFGLVVWMPLYREQLWWADAISVAVFTVVGTQVALQTSAFVPTSYLSWCIPPLMGLITGFGGGLVRDLVADQMPGVMKDPSDAMISLGSGGLYMLLNRFHILGAGSIVVVVASSMIVFRHLLTVKRRVLVKTSTREHLSIKY